MRRPRHRRRRRRPPPLVGRDAIVRVGPLGVEVLMMLVLVAVPVFGGGRCRGRRRRVRAGEASELACGRGGEARSEESMLTLHDDGE